jgi:hypothetical protein
MMGLQSQQLKTNMETFKTGKRDPLPERPKVSFGQFLTTLPTAPLVDLAPNYSYPMDGNDKVGDCVIAGWDHFYQVVTGLLEGTQKNFTQDQIWTFYKTQNPNFDPSGSPTTNGPGSSSDNGMNIQIFLEYLVNNKYILGFASVDWKNEAELKAAIYLGLGVITGVKLQSAQMSQFNSGVWDTDPNSSIEGGHCIPLVGYLGTPDQISCVTWAKIINCTQPFIINQMDECWFVLTEKHIEHPNFRDSFNLKAFSDAVATITNGKVIVPINPILKLGSTGVFVKTLQNYLNKDLGLSLIVDGSFGKITLNAVKTFQMKYHLAADGVVGNKTWTAFAMIDDITLVCNQNGVEPLLGIAVASCESNLNPQATLFNPPSNSTDRGLYQWNSVYHAEITDLQAFDPMQACKLFCDAVKAGKLVNYWSASMPNWKKMLTPDIIQKYNIV